MPRRRARRTRVVDGVEYEVLWDGAVGSPSLTRSEGFGDSSLAALARDAGVERLGRHGATLAKARREWSALWGEDDEDDEEG